MSYQDRFIRLIQRMQSDRYRYDALCVKIDDEKNANEKEIANICRYFTFDTGDMYSDKNVRVRNDLIPQCAYRKLDELEYLLNKEGWGIESRDPKILIDRSPE